MNRARPQTESTFKHDAIRGAKAFSRSLSLANSVKSEGIRADYQNGVLTLSIPKREEAKPKQIKVNVEKPALAAAAGTR